LVERDLAKVEVAGSKPVSRSKFGFKYRQFLIRALGPGAITPAVVPGDGHTVAAVSQRHLVPKERRAGTAYFGFQIGRADGSEREAFLGIDDFDKVEHVLRRCLGDFDYTGISAGSQKEWEEVALQLEALSMDASAPEVAEIAKELGTFLRQGLGSGQPIFLNGV
jgi:hypothetical protein